MSNDLKVLRDQLLADDAAWAAADGGDVLPAVIAVVCSLRDIVLHLTDEEQGR